MHEVAEKVDSQGSLAECVPQCKRITVPVHIHGKNPVYTSYRRKHPVYGKHRKGGTARIDYTD